MFFRKSLSEILIIDIVYHAKKYFSLYVSVIKVQKFKISVSNTPFVECLEKYFTNKYGTLGLERTY